MKLYLQRKKNEINLKIKIKKKDINKNIYFLNQFIDKNFTHYKSDGRFSSYCPIDIEKCFNFSEFKNTSKLKNIVRLISIKRKKLMLLVI